MLNQATQHFATVLGDYDKGVSTWSTCDITFPTQGKAVQFICSVWKNASKDWLQFPMEFLVWDSKWKLSLCTEVGMIKKIHKYKNKNSIHSSIHLKNTFWLPASPAIKDSSLRSPVRAYFHPCQGMSQLLQWRPRWLCRLHQDPKYPI